MIDSELMTLTPRWVNAPARRYGHDGVDALGHQRRQNAGATPLLSDEDLAAQHCCFQNQDRHLIAVHTNFHWWPKPITRN